MRRLVGTLMVVAALAMFTSPALAASPTAKFYDFSDQLIDGEIKKPTTLYTDSRTQVKFDRLLNLKKSFIKSLLATSKERVFK